MNTFSLRKKVGQLMMVGFHGKTPSEPIKELIRKHNIGGVLLFSRNIGTAEEVLQLTNALQLLARDAGHEFPLLISIDQENGTVRRLGEGTTVFPGNMALGAVESEEVTFDVARGTAQELRELGINMNLAPVLDVNNNPRNPVIGVRSFGENPDTVGRLGVAAIKGHQAEKVITTIKHFPGHGDTSVDSHLSLPTIDHRRNRLDEVELAPFRTAIEAGADCVMVAHVFFPAIESRDGVPATLSSAVIRGLLREELDFDGVVTTDCLEMMAIQDHFGTAEGALLGLQAGNDMIMVSHTYDLQLQSIERIVQSVENGEISESLVDEALARILRLKKSYLSWENQLFQNQVPESVNGRVNKQIATSAYQRSVTLVQNDGDILPFHPRPEQNVLVIYPTSNLHSQVEDLDSNHALGDAVRKMHSNVNEITVKGELTEEFLEGLAGQAMKADFIIVGTSNAHMVKGQKEIITRLQRVGKPLVVIAMRSPYDLLAFPDVPAYLASYEYTSPAMQVAAEIIFGKTKASGKLPVSLPGLYEQGHGLQ